LKKAREFVVKLGETVFMILITLWVLNKRNIINIPFSLLDLEDYKLIEIAIALKASLSFKDFERIIIK
jgi:hypothetical protein